MQERQNGERRPSAAYFPVAKTFFFIVMHGFALELTVFEFLAVITAMSSTPFPGGPGGPRFPRFPRFPRNSLSAGSSSFSMSSIGPGGPRTPGFPGIPLVPAGP